MESVTSSRKVLTGDITKGNKFEILKQMKSNGVYSTIFIAKNLKNEEIVIVKELKKDPMIEPYNQREIKALRELTENGAQHKVNLPYGEVILNFIDLIPS